MIARPRRRFGSFLIVLGLLLMGGCLKFPLGDPEQSKVDDRLIGAWQAEKDGTLVVATAYDGRTYAVSVYEPEDKEKAPAAAAAAAAAGTAPQPLHATGDFYKAWLTPLAGANFVTLQDVGAKPMMRADDAPYMVASWALSKDEAGKDVLTFHGVSPDFVKRSNVTDAAGLAKLLAENANNAAAYLKDPSVYHRISADTLHELLLPPTPQP